MIVTSRRVDLSRNTLHVKPLQEISDSLAILQSRSKKDNVQSDPFAKRLAKRLDGFPLALAAAGVYVQLTGLDFERYLQEYEAHWNIDPSRPITLQEYHDRTLYTTWDISYAHLTAEDSYAAKFLKVLAYFDNQSLWYELFHAGVTKDSPEWLRHVVADDVTFRGVMTTLTKFSFLMIDGVSGSWRLNDEWLAHASLSRISRHALRPADKRFLVNDMILITSIDRLDSLLSRFKIQLDITKQMCIRARSEYGKSLGPNHISTLNAVHNLGILYGYQGKLEKAEQMHMRARSGYEKALGPNHTSTLNTVHTLGIPYRDQGKLDKAEQMHMRARSGYEKALGPNHISTLDAVYTLGILYGDQGKMDKAEQMQMRALSGYEKALGPNHISILRAMHTLEIIYADQGKLDKAKQMYMRAISRYEKALGPDHTIPQCSAVLDGCTS